MVVAAPLLIGSAVRANLARLREAAAARPIDVLEVRETVKTEAGRRAHQARMGALTVVIPGPWPFTVTYSIDTGHPAGTCRHMSVANYRAGRVPSEEAVRLLAVELGFSGGLEACRVWPEHLSEGGIAINVVQPIAVGGEA
jgi:hypothetical protein